MSTHISSIVLVENNINSLKSPMDIEMKKALEHFERELTKIRTGRAHTSLIEDLPVSCYGQAPAPLKNFAVLAAPDPELLTVQPWDVATIDEIERAIATSSLGLTPTNEGKIIRIRLPRMSSARREELTKLLGKKLEDCKTTVRNIRKDFHNLLRDSKKDKKISEDFFNRLLDTLQKVTDDYIAKADGLAQKKEKELTTA